MATVNALLVQSYATNVYLTGRNTLSNIGTTRPDYVEPVKLKGAQAYYIDDIDHALTAGYITAEEHAETLALKTPVDPQYRPAAFAASAPENE